jgi:hypothetical protein
MKYKMIVLTERDIELRSQPAPKIEGELLKSVTVYQNACRMYFKDKNLSHREINAKINFVSLYRTSLETAHYLDRWFSPFKYGTGKNKHWGGALTEEVEEKENNK